MRSATRKRVGKDKAYLAWLHTLPCVIHHGGLLRCKYDSLISEVAHLGSHGISQKAPDLQAVPMCRFHHQSGQHSIHRLGPEAFWTLHGLDPDAIIARLNAEYEAQR